MHCCIKKIRLEKNPKTSAVESNPNFWPSGEGFYIHTSKAVCDRRKDNREWEEHAAELSSNFKYEACERCLLLVNT